MSAQPSVAAWDPLDEPVPFVLTELGLWATDGWVTTEQAAGILSMPRESVAALASRGCVSGRKVGREWLLRREEVEKYLVERRGRGARPGRRLSRPAQRKGLVRLPAGPLVELVERRGGPAACGVRHRSAEEVAYFRARREGSLTERAADQLTVRLLGLTPREVWPGI